MMLLQLFGHGAMPLSKNLQELRKGKGLRQEQLAELAGVSLTQISKIERDDADPRVSTVEKLAKALECSTAKLLFNEENEGLDGMLKRSFDRLQRLSGKDKAAVLKVINMACAGGMVIKGIDELYKDATEDYEEDERAMGTAMHPDDYFVRRANDQIEEGLEHDEYHQKLDQMAKEEDEKRGVKFAGE